MRHNVFLKIGLTLLLANVLLASAVPVRADDESAGAWPDVLYVFPFLNVMIPDDVSGPLFDDFIDRLMAAGSEHGVTIRILKQDVDAVDKTWLADRSFVTGELFGYIQESGCCSTSIEAKVRAYLHRPGSAGPVAEVVVPGETFFDHDLATLDAERRLLAEKMADELAGGVMERLAETR